MHQNHHFLYFFFCELRHHSFVDLWFCDNLSAPDVSSVQDTNGRHTTKGGGNTYAEKYLGFFDSFAFEQLKQAKYFKFQGVGRCTLSRQRFKLVGIISILASWDESRLKSYKLKKHGKISPKLSVLPHPSVLVIWEIWHPTFIISELSGTWYVYYTILITSQHCIYVWWCMHHRWVIATAFKVARVGAPVHRVALCYYRIAPGIPFCWTFSKLHYTCIGIT